MPSTKAAAVVPSCLNEQVFNFVHVAKRELQQHPNLSFTAFAQRVSQQTQYNHGLLQQIESLPSLASVNPSQGALRDQTVSIVGAGLAGLLAAYVLAEHGAQVEIFEKRTKDKARTRPQNISFKEAESRLKPLLGEQCYQQFFQRGGALDGDTGKLRITTGSFQDILTEALSNHPRVHSSYHHNITHADIDTLPGDTLLIATGAHACERLHLSEHFNPQYFPKHAVCGQSALGIRESNHPAGYFRKEREGYHWRRDNLSFFQKKCFMGDLTRLRYHLKNPTHSHLEKIISLPDATRIEYTFCFGNDTPEFFTNFPAAIDDYVIMKNHFKVIPMLCLNPISQLGSKRLIAIGDANGSPHPLAAIGTLKFTRNVSHLIHLMATPETHAHHVALAYKSAVLLNSREVFFNNLLACVYSLPRQD